MKKFLEHTFFATIYTMAEAALGVIGGSTLITEVDWRYMLAAVSLAGVVTVLKCIIMDLKKYELEIEQEKLFYEDEEEDEDNDNA